MRPMPWQLRFVMHKRGSAGNEDLSKDFAEEEDDDQSIARHTD